jgi:hypothetical protein
MATVLGTSGAWKDVKIQLSASNISARNTLEVKQKINELEQQRHWQYQIMEQEFLNKVQALHNGIQQKQFTIQSQIDTLQSQTDAQIQKLDAEIIDYKTNIDSQLNEIEQRIKSEWQRLEGCAESHQTQIKQAIEKLRNKYDDDNFDLNSREYKVNKTFHVELSTLEQEKVSIQQRFKQVPEELHTINNDIALLENEKAKLAKQGFIARIFYWLHILVKWQWSSSYKSQLSRLSRYKNQYIEQFNFQHEQAINQINAAIDEKQKNYAAELQKIKVESQLLAERYERDKIQAERVLKTQQRNLYNSLNHNKARLLQDYETVYQRLEKQKINLKQQEQASITAWYQSIKAAQQQYQSLQANRENFIKQGCDQLLQNIENLHRIIYSSSFIGAEAELAVINQLSYLPNSYYVLNDVHLRLHHYTKCFDNRIISAQIDHLVIAPTGVFLIETKNWSQKFAETGNYYNPYQQAHCATWLCICYLKEILGIQVKVRAIVAYWGSLPSKDKKYFAKPKPIEEINGYIKYFREPALNKYQIEKIVNNFSPPAQSSGDNYLRFY